MEFHFQHPLHWGGRIGAEVEMMAELSGSPDDPNVDALYAYELAPGNPRYEIERDSFEWKLACMYLLSNRQELERIADEWPDDERPRASRGHEHSTMWSALR